MLRFEGGVAGLASGQGPAAVIYNALVGFWSWKMHFSQSSTLHGSAQTSIFHFWNVYILILAGFAYFFFFSLVHCSFAQVKTANFHFIEIQKAASNSLAA